ncbi:MAG: metallophosphoesterase [Tepidisphaeraceae bacterium]|jgi:predicted MPP superfamily phosphohydrolase
MMHRLVEYLNKPHWHRQEKWRRAIWMNMARLGLTGMHALPVNRRWVDIHRRPMPMKNLDPAMAGWKIVQISDLHYSPVVWQRYLTQYLNWVNDLEPELVVVTGDLITGGYRFARQIATLLSRLKAKHGVICTFGNHDYSIYGRRVNGEGQRRADFLESCLRKRGLIVLRNQSLRVKSAGAQKPLVIVGLDDEWSGNIDPGKAFAGIDSSQPTICLNHNPANVRDLMGFPWQWMLSGHTHGRQVATSKLGRALYPHRFRHYTHGYYSVSGRHLYVNRGLSYGQRVQDWCRPEISVFKLEVGLAGA